MKIITSSTLPTALTCMGMAVSKCLGARGKMDSEVRDAVETIIPPVEKKQGILAVVGTASHAGAESALTDRMKNQEISVSAATDKAIELLRSVDAVSYDDEIRTARTAEKVTRKLVKYYSSEIAPTVLPVSIEERLQASIGNGWILSGKADVIESDAVGDHKFGKGSGYMAQLGSGIILARANQYNVSEAWVDRVKRPRGNAEPEYHRLRYNGPEAVDLAKQVIKEIVTCTDKFLQDGNPDHFRFNPGNMLCTDKYCPAFGSKFCKYTTK